jgi:hypothetical protein
VPRKPKPDHPWRISNVRNYEAWRAKQAERRAGDILRDMAKAKAKGAADVLRKNPQ